MKPVASEPDCGQISFFLESSQTGRSLFVREDAAENLKQRMLSVLQNLFANIVDRRKLCIFNGQFCWNLQVDVLIFAELSLVQLDYLCLAVRSAFLDLELPQTIATMNNNTGKIEVGLVEEVYADRENTDKPVTVVDKVLAVPYVVSLGIAVDEMAGDQESQLPIVPLLDATEEELQCLDQVLHLAVTMESPESPVRIHGMV